MEWERVLLKLSRSVAGYALSSLRNRAPDAELEAWEGALCEELGLVDAPEEETPLTVITISPGDLAAPAPSAQTTGSAKKGSAARTKGRAKAGRPVSSRKTAPQKCRQNGTAGTGKTKLAVTRKAGKGKATSNGKSASARGRTTRTVTRKAG